MTNPRNDLSDAISWVHQKGWAAATAGNFSSVVTHSPLVLLMSPSGVDKGTLAPEALVEVSGEAKVIAGSGKASAETLLHVAVVEETGAGAVLHTHSKACTILSKKLAEKGALEITGFELLKALSGVTTHEHKEIIPILKNSQDMAMLQVETRKVLKEYPGTHGFMLSGHGLYTWGKDLAEARRHLEALEFLFEVVLAELTC